MPLINAVQWRDAGEDEVARRFPDVSLNYGSQLTVMENQWGVFFKDGKALDVFDPGRHTITSKNIPILTDLVQRLGIIGDIFECEVVFVNKSQARVNFGGKAYSAPSGQVMYQAEIGFYGYVIIKVDDPKLFVTEFLFESTFELLALSSIAFCSISFSGFKVVGCFLFLEPQ